jgi:hypothetical protein
LRASGVWPADACFPDCVGVARQILTVAPMLGPPHAMCAMPLALGHPRGRGQALDRSAPAGALPREAVLLQVDTDFEQHRLPHRRADATVSRAAGRQSPSSKPVVRAGASIDAGSLRHAQVHVRPLTHRRLAPPSWRGCALSPMRSRRSSRSGRVDSPQSIGRPSGVPDIGVCGHGTIDANVVGRAGAAPRFRSHLTGELRPAHVESSERGPTRYEAAGGLERCFTPRCVVRWTRIQAQIRFLCPISCPNRAAFGAHEPRRRAEFESRRPRKRIVLSRLSPR